MSTVGLAMAWGTRISRTARNQEKRVERTEEPAGGPVASADAQSEDAALAAACRRGDLRAYERLYELHGTRMKSLARNLLGNHTDAEDAVQETFLKVQRAIGGYSRQVALFALRFRVLVHSPLHIHR